MKENKNVMYIGIGLGVCAFILFLTMTYAAFTEQLKIEGKASVSKATWSIKFANLKPVVKKGSAVEVTAPTINTNDTKISEYEVTLSDPGDSIEYDFDVVNNGTFDAKISSITIPTPTCTGAGTNATTDASNVCNNLTYTLTYADGTAIKVGDTLNAGQTKNLKLVLTYSNAITAALLPTDDVQISNLSIAVIYEQS